MDPSEFEPPAALWDKPSWLLGRAALAGDRLVADALAEVGVRRQHYAVLVAIAEEPGTSQAEVGRRLDMDVSDVHAVIGELEGWELVQRSRDQRDQRRNVLVLTAPGRRELAKLERRVLGAQEALLADLSPTARRNLVSALKALVASA